MAKKKAKKKGATKARKVSTLKDTSVKAKNKLGAY